MRSLLLLLVATPIVVVQAQTPATVAIGAAITPDKIAQHLRVLSADSFQSHGPPNAALERTARYVAAQFARLGLTPAGDQARKLDSAGQIYQTANGDWAVDTLWLQRYPLPGQSRINYTETRLGILTLLHAHDKPILTTPESQGRGYREIFFDFRSTARFATEITPRLGLAALGGQDHPGTLLTGYHTLVSVQQAQLHGEYIFCVLPRGGDTAEQHRVLTYLAADNYLVILRDEDSAAFVRRRDASLAHPPELVDDYIGPSLGAPRWAVEVWPEAEAMQSALAVAGLDWATLRAERAPGIRRLPFTWPRLRMAVTAPVDPANLATAPNVVGMLTGSGEKSLGYQSKYVVISASLGDTDGSDGGANNGLAPAARAGGLASLLALAEAFSQSGVRPRFSVIFLATSGGSWGSSYFLRGPDVVAHLGLGEIGRGTGDSVWIAGLQDLDMEASPTWVIGAHPELGLTAADDESSSDRAAAHFAFARSGVPSLSLRGTLRGPVSAGAAAIDTDYVARVARAALYLGWELANARKPPGWTAEGRRRFLHDRP